MKVDHTKFANVGSHNHDEIDDHIDSTSNPHAVTASQVGGLPSGDQSVTYNANTTVNFASGATARITLTGGCAITLSNLVDGCVYRLILIQDGTGSRVATWVTTIKWAEATAPTLTLTANRADIITFVKANSIIYGAATLNFG